MPERSPDTAIQQQLATLSARRWDVIVIGAGPAGAVCAHVLAERGLAVLLLDKEKFPRDKVCGDLLIADSLVMLRQIGLYDRIAGLAHRSDAIEVFSPFGATFAIPGEFLTLKRRRLDFELARHASASGAVFAAANVVAIDRPTGADCTLVRTSEAAEPLEAGTVVVATGSVVDLALDCGLATQPDPSAIALRHYVRSTYEVKNTIIAYDRAILPGYGWIVPLGRGRDGAFRYNLGCGTSYRFVQKGRHHLKRTLAAFTERFEPARAVMAQGEATSKTAGASLRCGLEEIDLAVGDGALGIGDTIGAIYPFTGEGIGKAMATGAAAGEVIADCFDRKPGASLDQYLVRLRAIKPRYAGYVTAEKWLGHPRLNDFVAGRIARSPHLQAKIQEFIAETGDPGELFKFSSLISSYWR